MGATAILSLIALGIGAVTGVTSGILNVVDYNQELKKYKSDIEKNQNELTENPDDGYTSQLEQALNRLDINFQADKNAANKTADDKDLQAKRTDQLATKAEKVANSQFADEFNLLEMNWQSDALNWNTAAMQIGSNKGNSLSQIASSGTRSSSMMDAVEMDAAVNAAQLQMEKDATKAQNNYRINSLIHSLSSNKDSIQKDRWNATDLRNDASYTRALWEEGGDQYNIYQNNINDTKSDAQRAYQKLQDELDYYTNKKNVRRGRATSFFGGFQSGFNSGYSDSKFVTDLFKTN